MTDIKHYSVEEFDSTFKVGEIFSNFNNSPTIATMTKGSMMFLDSEDVEWFKNGYWLRKETNDKDQEYLETMESLDNTPNQDLIITSEQMGSSVDNYASSQEKEIDRIAYSDEDTTVMDVEHLVKEAFSAGMSKALEILNEPK